MHRIHPRSIFCAFAFVLMALALITITPAASAQSRETSTPADWLEKMDKQDRACLDAGLGKPILPIPDTIKWYGTKPLAWDDLYGSVVVVQSFTNMTFNSYTKLQSAQAIVDRSGGSSDDIIFLGIHTPESASMALRFLEGRRHRGPVAIDRDGRLCDSLGLFKNPASVVIDRQGVVRYAGLNDKGLKEAIGVLAKEKFDRNAIPKAPEAPAPKPEATRKPEPSRAPAVKPIPFPRTSGTVRSAKDLRGKRAPKFHVTKWFKDKADLEGKVVIIDFWATWCGPCRASIPHNNKLAKKFRDDLVIIGLSDERKSDYDRGMSKYNLRNSQFEYSLALDPGARMKKAVKVTGIPHVMVISSDWIVRWQGHPSSLDERTLGSIIKANKSLGGAAPVSPSSPSRSSRDDNVNSRNRWARLFR